MIHDNAHCSDFTYDCPDECYRAQLVRDLKNLKGQKIIISWAHLKGTSDCLRDKGESTMTIEELRREAKKLGYNIIKIKKTEKLLPCVCGCNRREHWHSAFDQSESLVCKKCGRFAEGKNKDEAIHNWNVMIKEEMKLKGEYDLKNETSQKMKTR